MSRATYGAARHRKKVRILKQAKGFRGGPGKRWRLAQEAVIRAGVNAYRDRRRRKRNFRELWVTRIAAACRMREIPYSRFMFGLATANVELNRKMLSEMAIHAPKDFDALIELARQHQPKEKAA